MKRVHGAPVWILAWIACAVAGAAGEATAQAGLDTAAIRRITGVRGTASGGEYKVSVPQNDLDVRVDGFRIVPPMGTGSWAGFTPAPGGAMVMGDIVVRPEEIGPVQRAAVEHGLSVSGLHNHFVRDEPKVMFMHLHGTGRTEDLARGVRAVLDRVAALRGRDPAAAPAASVASTLDTARIAAVLGHPGELGRGVYRVTIGRPDVRLTDHGVPVSSFLGFNTWAAFQGTVERAAVAGDFAMLEHEVPAVIEALVRNGIEVVAVHNHMTTEQPRIFFLHYWGVGPAERLARGLRAGLDATGRRGAGGGRH
ncbi:MAG: DUF1259 domain-containing protein [Gemmatimonadota bacterium]